MTRIVTALFDRSEDAQGAVEDLLRGGWAEESVSLVARVGEGSASEHSAALRDAEKGAVVGGLSGLLIGLTAITVPGIGPILAGGWLVTALLGAGVGAGVGGLAGALVDAGTPHDEAHRLAEGVHRGGVLVTVRTEEAREPLALELLTKWKPRDVREKADATGAGAQS